MDAIKKQRFGLPNCRLLSGSTLDIEVGYETYGQLNAAGNNAVLVCHYWTGTSHAAGRYAAADPLPGWWDALIGPGKVIDTNHFFVVCSDTLANVQAHDPNVISTGPASIDAATGEPYGSRFPVLTIRDMVHVQRALMDHLGITHVRAVGGPSAGGMQALEWACTYPDFMDKVFGVCTYGRSNAFFTLGVYRWCRAFLQSDPHWHGGDYYSGPGPQQGLRRALGLITLLAQAPARINATARASDSGWDLPDGAPPYTDPDGVFPYEPSFNAFIDERARFADANAFLAIARAATLHNVGWRRRGFAEALSAVRAEVLMIPCEHDLFFPPGDSRDVVDAILQGGGRAELYTISSDWGHFACVFDTDRFAVRLRDFLKPK
nr:homoserine O-acetyltransferase [Gammaproteobacteria bacterium]